MIEIEPGYWQRAVVLRAKTLAKGCKAHLGDALIAQSGIDRGIPLLTRDRDFRAFGDATGLELVLGIGTDWPRLATGHHISQSCTEAPPSKRLSPTLIGALTLERTHVSVLLYM